MAEEPQFSSSRPDNKRKFDDPSPPQSYNNVPPPLDGIQLAKLKAQEIAAKLFSDAEAKRPKGDNIASAADDYMQKPLGQQQAAFLGGLSQPASFTSYGYGTSKKINIPNGRVGVIIGRSGDTIKQLQLQSGAKIQVTRDMDADPNSLTRPVELTGTPDQINRAEELINNVLAEADAGSSGTLAARKVGGGQPGTEQFVMKIPNNKVGLIIGKGGETIKNMQANSGARIQVIPLHLPPGETCTERTLQIDGTNEQIEAAKKLVNEIVSGENRARNLNMGGYPQSYHHPQPPTSWGPPGGPPPPMQQQPGYGYAQPGAYPGAHAQYAMPQPPYGGSYPPQPAASGAYSTGWDQASIQGTQQTTAQATTGYDYYNQQQQQSTTTAADNAAYGYGQGSYSDAYGYSQPASGYEQSYGSSAPPAYGQTTVNPTQDGSGSGSGSTYAAPGGIAPAASVVQPSPTQQGYTSQSGYGAPPTYGQSPQSQKPPAAATQPAYGQPPTSQGGYAPPPAQPMYGQVPPPPPAAQPGYTQPYQQVAPPYGGPSQAGYGQQQGYGDSYGSVGGYSQPQVYGNEGGAAPAAAGGVTKTSPQS